jgi:predicted RNase H-like HicB family nuclease
MKFRVILEYDAEARSYSAVCPELPGCASAGDTEEEATRNIEEAIRLYLSPAEIDLPENAKLAEVTVG